MSILESSVTHSDVDGDVLHIRYVPLPAFNLDLQLWKDNAKLHDLQMLDEAIASYGYADCAKWDSNLNGGEGGFVYGNGRTKALLFRLALMKQQGEDPPKGIGTLKTTHEWVVPVKFGVDALSEKQAEAFGFSHNILTMAGSDFSAHDIAKMFDSGFSKQLEGLADEDSLPIGYDGDYLDALLRYEELEAEGEGAFNPPKTRGDESGRPITIFLEPTEMNAWNTLKEAMGANNDKAAFLRLLKSEA